MYVCMYFFFNAGCICSGPHNTASSHQNAIGVSLDHKVCKAGTPKENECIQRSETDATSP